MAEFMIMSIGKAMKASSRSLANPKFPSMAAALLHSTSLLSRKKRTYWPERSDCRGLPRRRIKLVYKSSQLIRDFWKLRDHFQTSWNWTTEDQYLRAQAYYSSKHSGNSSSKSSNIASPDMTSDRLALGLSATGPLSLEHVKIAYRACAMKWHPDHHQGFSKAFAEEKFKICNVAYQSLCNKLSKH